MLLIITAQPITCTIAHGYSKAEMTVHDMYTMGWCRVNHTTIHWPRTYFHRSLQFSSINRTTDNFCIRFIFCICRLHISWMNTSVYSTSVNLRVLEPAALKQFVGEIFMCVCAQFYNIIHCHLHWCSWLSLPSHTLRLSACHKKSFSGSYHHLLLSRVHSTLS